MITREDCLDDATIAALAQGESAAREALAHLERCASCRELASAACVRRTDAAPSEPGPRLAPGFVLGGHRIERPLGVGGMGIVYLARDVELDRDVAVKALRAGDERAHEHLVRESQALARLNHPNVVTAYEVVRHDGVTYLVMEHVDGGTVRDWLALAPRSPAEIANVYAQCARGLAAAHASGLVHRDIKPDNVLVGLDGRARISDFGLAHSGEAGATWLAGTPGYMAPEVLADAPADAASDQWGLCASLWDSLFGAPPFPGTTREELLAAMVRGEPEPPDEPDLPAWLRRAVLRGLSREPAARYPSLEALADALAPAQRSARRTAMLVIASAALAAGAGAVFGAHDPEPACRSDIDDIWNAARRGKLPAPAAAAIDDYASQWSAQRAEVCRLEERDRDGRLPALRAACLDVRRRALGTLLEVLGTVDAAGGARAADAVANLPALEDCTATERLAGRQPRPTDRARQAELVALERRFDAARSLTSLGQRRAQLAELVAIADRAAAIDYQPLAADALDTAGRDLHALGDATAFATLRRALWAAQVGGDDRQLSDVATALVTVAAQTSRPLTERDELRAQARAAAARLRWRNDPRAAAAASLLAAAEATDDLARGALDTAERELREAIELGIKAFGPRSPHLSMVRLELAKMLTPTEPDTAAVMRAASIDIDGDVATAAQAAALIDAGWQLFSVGRDDQARALVRKARALVTSKSSPFLSVLLDDLEGEIAIATGDVDAARTLNQRALQGLGPHPVAAHAAALRITTAEILERTGDCATAAREYGAAAASITNDVEAKQIAELGQARCLVQLGESATARKLVEAQVRTGLMNPRVRPKTWRLLAELRWRDGERDAARAAAETGLAASDKLPALVADRAALRAWLAAH